MSPLDQLLNGFLLARQHRQQQEQIAADRAMQAAQQQFQQGQAQERSQQFQQQFGLKQKEFDYSKEQDVQRNALAQQKLQEDIRQADIKQQQFDAGIKSKEEIAKGNQKAKASALLDRDYNMGLREYLRQGGTDVEGFTQEWHAAHAAIDRIRSQSDSQSPDTQQSGQPMQQESVNPLMSILGIGGNTTPPGASIGGGGGSGYVPPPGTRSRISAQEAAAGSRQAYADATRSLLPGKLQEQQAALVLKQVQKQHIIAQKNYIEAQARKLDTLLPDLQAEIQARTKHYVRSDELQQQTLEFRKQVEVWKQQKQAGNDLTIPQKQQIIRQGEVLLGQRNSLAKEREVLSTKYELYKKLVAAGEPEDADNKTLDKLATAHAALGTYDARTGRWNGPLAARLTQIEQMGKTISKMELENNALKNQGVRATTSTGRPLPVPKGAAQITIPAQKGKTKSKSDALFEKYRLK